MPNNRKVHWICFSLHTWIRKESPTWVMNLILLYFVLSKMAIIIFIPEAKLYLYIWRNSAVLFQKLSYDTEDHVVMIDSCQSVYYIASQIYICWNHCYHKFVVLTLFNKYLFYNSYNTKDTIQQIFSCHRITLGSVQFRYFSFYTLYYEQMTNGNSNRVMGNYRGFRLEMS